MQGKDLVSFIFRDMKERIRYNRVLLDTIITRSERSEVAGAFVQVSLANVPFVADGAKNGDQLYITDGRKTGEGAGLGTGIPAYFDEIQNTWLRYSDDTAVVA